MYASLDAEAVALTILSTKCDEKDDSDAHPHPHGTCAGLDTELPPYVEAVLRESMRLVCLPPPVLLHMRTDD